MMSNYIRYLVLAAGILFLDSCKHPFDLPAIPANNRHLVVEGFIQAGTDATSTFTLSRIQDIALADSLIPELHAVISIEGQGGDSYPLLEEGNGNYSADHLNLAIPGMYRLNISTADGNKYLSDFVPAKKTPPIDSLEWKQNSDVTIYVNTHDPLDSTRYYRWDYVETWDYRSNLTSPWGVTGDRIFVKDSLTQTDSCWRTTYSTDIVLGNSVALSKDLISHFPVATVPINSEKISLRYSILVRQYALTKEAYQFHLTLQKNTQQTGSLFDPQPSQLPTNIHCVTNPSEPVVGYVSASSVEEKRIFIKYTEVTQWQYPGLSTDCTLKNTPKDPNDILHFTYPDTSYTLYYFVSGTGPAVIVKKACTYCTYFGGSNMKPSFW